LNGLLVKLPHLDGARSPGEWFWKLFRPIRADLDRLFWCFPCQPWMGAPAGFQDDEAATASFEGVGRTSVMLWRPGSLSHYADTFMEEFVELWGIDPTADDAPQLAARYSVTPWRDMAGFVRDHARVWLLYTDSSCWEIYARKQRLLDETRAHLWGKPGVEVYESHAERRGAAFDAAGLSEVWAALNGRYP
jgi:hypothetical protein